FTPPNAPGSDPGSDPDSVGEPDALVGFEGEHPGQVVDGHAGEQVRPLIGADEVDVTEGDLLHFVADVVDAEDGLFAAHALAPEAEQLQAQMQGELGGVGVESRLGAADSDQA